MISYTDQIGRLVTLQDIPRRIVSLVPSQTELLFSLGLEDRVVGITKFCVHPSHWKKEKKIVGGTKILKFKTIESLKPDLIIANKEENRPEDIKALEELCPVWVSDVHHLQGAIDMIQQISSITGASKKGTEIISEISSLIGSLKPEKTRRTLYLIWKKPWMAAGSDTFISDMMSRCGLMNVVEELRYPELGEDDFKQLQPELVLFSSEPYPFKEHHMKRIAEVLPNARLQLVDGEAFSWYGSRLIQSAAYFQRLLTVLNQPFHL
jgi:ABC-type Fe3+-hydroxamate transport system substrate-binding protein